MGRRIEILFWSVALPGLGQILNGKWIKGFIFVGLEFLVNVQANFNTVIISSFHGEIEQAVDQTNFQWLMFYPCLYFFAMWDAYKNAEGRVPSYSFFPFVFAAFFVTAGVIYSPTLKIMGVLWGPVWLPIGFILPGVSVGMFFRFVLIRMSGKFPKP
jgi:hypothetical protein